LLSTSVHVIITILELAQNTDWESPFHFNALHGNAGTAESSFYSQLLPCSSKQVSYFLNPCFQNFTVAIRTTVFYSSYKKEKLSSLLSLVIFTLYQVNQKSSEEKQCEKLFPVNVLTQ